MKAILHKQEWIQEGELAEYISEEIELPKKNRLKFLQKLVGGYIDICHHEGHDLVLNDEGILLGLPQNAWAAQLGLLLFGNIVEIFGKLD